MDDCATSLTRNKTSIFRYLNPMSWVNGVSSLGDFVMMVTDILVYVCVLVVVYVVLTKIVIPICKCWICPMYIMTHRSKSSKRREKSKRREEEDEGMRV